MSKAATMLEQVPKSYEEDYAHFRKYHQHPWNIAIHMITIPFEWFGWILWVSILNLHFPITFYVAAYHLYIPENLSYGCTVLHVAFGMLAHFIRRRLTWQQLLIIGGILQAVAWFSQVIIGHFIIERNSPSMTKKFTLSSVIFSVMLSLDIYRKPKVIVEQLKGEESTATPNKKEE